MITPTNETSKVYALDYFASAGISKPSSLISSGLSNQPQVNNNSTFDKPVANASPSVVSQPEKFDLFTSLGVIVENIGKIWTPTNTSSAKTTISNPVSPSSQLTPTLQPNKTANTGVYSVQNELTINAPTTSPMNSNNSYLATQFSIGGLPIKLYYNGNIGDVAVNSGEVQTVLKSSNTVRSFDILPFILGLIAIFLIIKLIKR